MPDVVRRTVEALTPPTAAERAEAVGARGDAAAHRCFAAWSSLNEIELVQPPAPAAAPSELTVAAWNIERGKHVQRSAGVAVRSGVDVLLATELDHGMARSGQRHTPRELAAALGFGYAFGVEFVELGLGDEEETRDCAGSQNAHGLHGNAILSRWPLRDVAQIPLDDGGDWFVSAPKGDDQLRVGGRTAISAVVDTAAGPLLVAATHFENESESDADGRARQARRMLDGLSATYGPMPAIIGGDLNVKGFRAAGLAGSDLLADPAAVEPCFAVFAEHGFDWRPCNTGEVTTRRHPHHPPGRGPQTIDWLFVRNVRAHGPFVAPALSDDGVTLSDHELIGTRICP